jgi:hypothetical protein
MVAIVRQLQPTQVTRATPFVERRAATSGRAGEMLGSALSEMGGALWEMEDELATAHAYQVDAEWTDFLRRVQHGDGEGDQGFYGLKGVDAINAREGVVGTVQEKYRELVESLNPRVRAATVRSMEARYQSFIKTANTFTAGQATAARRGAAEARDRVSRLAAYDALAAGDIEGFDMQVAAIRAQIEEDPKYLAADEDGRRLMIWKQLEPLYKEYIDEVVRTDGASAALAVAEQGYSSGVIGPSTVMDARQKLGEAAEVEGALAAANAAINTGTLTMPTGTYSSGSGDPAPTGDDYWSDPSVLPMGQ